MKTQSASGTTLVSHRGGSGGEHEKLISEIMDLRSRWGDELVILTHHYQRPEIVSIGDVRGDSFELAREASRRSSARHIVFCGVVFMAEAAAVVARPDQKVYHPDPSAACPLAAYADEVQVERAMQRIGQARGPGGAGLVTYMNSDIAVKAVAGRTGGTVCTSSSAARAFEWTLEHRDAVLFVPDEHLGRNTARACGLQGEDIVVWDPWQPGGGLADAQIRRARAILWKGHCHVHTWFRPDHVQAARKRSPDALVYVHPECHSDVVLLADGAGSTRYLVEATQKAPAGSTVYIGTEVNLVTRLAIENPEKTILPLGRSLCPNMFRTTLRKLRDTLFALPLGEAVVVPAALANDARLALGTMLESLTSRIGATRRD